MDLSILMIKHLYVSIFSMCVYWVYTKNESEYEQEIPQSNTAD